MDAADSSFRSRLRDALRQSVVGRPAVAPFDAGADNRVGPQKPGETGEPGGPGQASGAGEAGGEEHAVERIHYEFEDDPQTRANAEQSAWIADTLGGAWEHDGQGLCLVIDRVYAADRPHGNTEIGRYAETLERYAGALHAFNASQAAPSDATGSLFEDFRDEVVAADPCVGPLTPSDRQRQFLFFDLETTGLSGGAGTCAFLIGFGWFEGRDFRTRQYFLGGYGHEAAMLRMAARQLTEDRTLASFNGKTFDVPLIQGRYLFHRLGSPFDAVTHIDLLQPARRLWRHRPLALRGRGSARDDAYGSYFRSAALRQQYRTIGRAGRRLDLSDYAASCSLGVLEDAILGFYRRGDVPGAEIPSRYFHYVRTSDPRQLTPVLEHNRLDLVSLASVASIVARMLHEGADSASTAHECLALGRMYERSGETERAAACYQRAVDGTGSHTWSGDAVVQREALRHLAIRYRRERRYDEAAAAWQRVLDLDDAEMGGAASSSPDLDVLLALAIHHEHRSKNFAAARACVLRALSNRLTATEQKALTHRLARIERKLGR